MYHQHLLAALMAGLVLLPLSAPAQEKGPPPREVRPAVDVPYRLTDTKHVLVRVKLNDKGPFNFIIDTGAPALILSEQVAEKIGVKASADSWIQFDSMVLEGGLSIPEAKGLALDMFQLKGMNSMGFAGCELHGVIGFNILARYRIRYDFTQDTLAFTPVPFELALPKRIETKGGNSGQGSLEMMGNMMKMLSSLTGAKPNFDVVPRGFLGAELESGVRDLVVKSVLPDGPADRAGLKAGDRIQAAKGKSTEKPQELLEAVSKLPVGASVKLSIRRGEETKDITIELGRGL